MTNLVKLPSQHAPTEHIDDATPMTLEEMKQATKNMGIHFTQDLVDNINQHLLEPDARQNLRENLLGYVSVLRTGSFTAEQYVNAVKYVSFKLLGFTNNEAYAKTFPFRYQKLIANGAETKTISAYVSAYNKTLLVTRILEQSIVPLHVLNLDVLQKAINTQAEIMVDPAVSPKVRSDAANSIMTHLKPAQEHKIQMDVNHGVQGQDALQDLKRATEELVAQQRTAISTGQQSAQAIAHSEIIEKETVD